MTYDDFSGFIVESPKINFRRVSGKHGGLVPEHMAFIVSQPVFFCEFDDFQQK